MSENQLDEMQNSSNCFLRYQGCDPYKHGINVQLWVKNMYNNNAVRIIDEKLNNNC